MDHHYGTTPLVEAAASRELLLERFRAVRQASLRMCEPLTPEAFRIQPIDEVNPPWWNLGHTSWFYVRNLLEPFGGEVTEEDEDYDFVLNSYYASLGSRVARCRRGLLTRPATEEIYRYRESVDRRMEELIHRVDEERWSEFAFTLTVGINHEQQHQELFYTEIKYTLSQDPFPLRRPYRERNGEEETVSEPSASEVEMLPFAGGLLEFGNLEGGWCWDNELPVHRYYLHPFAIQNRMVTNGEYLEFIEDGGYSRQLLWLDNGWAMLQAGEWNGPLYWERLGGQWWIWTLDGVRAIDPAEPVCHVSFYEADAFARWKSHAFADYRGARLPTEREWEHAVRSSGQTPPAGNLLGSGALHPRPAQGQHALKQPFGDVWEWTVSYYEPYPGYQEFSGALAEFNGKFMDNQRVLRGGSCVTPTDHIRTSYRNFWSPGTRFQFTGLRLAQEL
jgi:ergothioneine biosynthesis protein EgtB